MSRAVRGRSAHRAFTLIELLAVIAIIAILAGFLMPMLGRSMERGRGTQCLAHLRQWGTAATAYMADNNGVFPEKAFEKTTPLYSYARAWFNVMAPYVGSPTLEDLCSQQNPPRPGEKSIFVCPSLKFEELPRAPAGQSEPVFSYAYNDWIDRPGRSGSYSQLLRISQILKPSRFAVFGEVAQLDSDKMAGHNLHFRHDGNTTVNIAFADGHAKNFFRTNVQAQTENDNIGVIWNPEGNPPQNDPRW